MVEKRRTKKWRELKSKMAEDFKKNGKKKN